MKVSFEGLGEMVATFYNSQSSPVAEYETVKVSDSGEVSACASGDKLAGIALGCDADFAAVKLGGYVCVAYTSTAPAVGYSALVADGSGGVKTGASGNTYLVIDVDTDSKTVGFIL